MQEKKEEDLQQALNKVFEVGIDEVGRGAIFGPVFAAAVVLTEKNKFILKIVDIVVEFIYKHCNLILAYLPKELNERRPSYGTTIDIGWAIGLRKPNILVTDDAYLTEHPLIKANVNWVFEDFDNAIDVIHGLFDDYVN